jgi:hypothetical protein
MTTIAWKDNLIVADTQLTWDKHIRGKSTPKILTLPTGIILAGAGNAVDCLKAIRFFSNPEWDSIDYDLRPKLKSYESIVVINNRVCYTSDLLIPEPVADPFYAIGSGWKFALAAMAKGDSAIEAILFASTIDVYTNDELQIVDINEEANKTKTRARTKKSSRTE